MTKPRIARRAGLLLLAVLCGGCPPVDPGRDDAIVNPTLRSDDHVLGAANAPLVVVEYGDFECPVCGRFFDETYPTIKSEYVDSGRVRWVFRHFPLRTLHPRAQAAAEAAECAGTQEAFFAFHDLLFANQDDLSDAALRSLAAEAGLDLAAFDACVAAGRATRVQSDVDAGVSAGVTGTPSFLIDGQLVPGFQSAAQLRVKLDAALAKAD
ncbi:MAG: DsbA family protein [Phycisphaerae bacterium]